MTDQQHDVRRQWFSDLFRHAFNLGVEQISDPELITANAAYHRGETAAATAIQLWGPPKLRVVR